jgi:hypothetical protein
MTIRIKQQTTPKGRDWWEWSVWLEGTKKDLDAIDHVEYTLHPTFPNPVRPVANRRTGFRLDSSGWGEFTIYLEIKNKDGSTKKRRHYLKLNEPETSKALSNPKIGTPSPAKESLRRTVFVSGGTRDLDPIQAVREAFSGQNVEVVGPEDVKGGQELRRTVNDMIARADAAVFVISGRPNLWLNEEIKAAVKGGVPHILPLVVGANVEVPDTLGEINAIRVENPSAVGDMTQTIINQFLGKK